MRLSKKIFWDSTADYVLIFSVVLILFIGMLFLYSASPERSFTLRGNFALRQGLWLIFAASIFWGLLSIPFKRFYDIAYLLYGLNLLLLVLVLLLGHATRLGAQRWLDIGPVVFQPSELMKITFILAVARFLSGKELTEEGKETLGGAFLLTFVPAFLILKEPHLGTALILFPILFGMLYVAGLRRDYFTWLFFVPLIASPLGWFVLKEYQKQRLFVFVNPDIDPLGAGYTVIQSRISLGSGWLFGRGLFGGTKNSLNFLPERHTDFIFSVVGEEWGFLGSAALVLLYFLLMKRGLAIARRSRGGFACLVATGLTTLLAVHTFVNIAMTMGVLPVVGLPLPFVSYGGSWLTTCLIAVALLLGVEKEGESEL